MGDMNTAHKLRVCIIGAGAAGLSALQQLREAGYEAYCYEKTDRVGGHWHTDYDALHLITSRDTTYFEDFPMPAHYPHFPRRDQVRAYIESYAQHHGHYDLIHFNTEIVSVTPEEGESGPVGSHGWRVISSRGDEGTFDAVAVANGHLWDPFIPPVPGEFSGTQLHSSEYNNVHDLQGDRILVVGAGNSGCDLAADVAQHRLEADIVVKDGVFFQPKTFFGRPRQELALLKEFNPEEQDLLQRLLARVSIGQNSDYPGLPQPQANTLAGGPTTVNDLVPYWIQHGRIQVVPGSISSLDGNTVHFANGTSGEYDSILWATGFNVRLPFLDDNLITWQSKVPVRYAGGILPEGVENLYFVGLSAPRGPQIPIYGMQAKLVARMLRLNENAEYGGLALGSYFAGLQEPDTRIDIVRNLWQEQMADTDRLLSALEAAATTGTPLPTGTSGQAG